MKKLPAIILLSAFLLTQCRQAQKGSVPADWVSDEDVVCGMKLKPDTQDTVHYQGKIYGFCSPSCKDEFLANPSAYVDKTPEKQ